MVAVCVKIHKILTFMILLIVLVSITLLVLFTFKGKKEVNPETYLKNLGYEFKLIDEKQIVIPKQFNDSMMEYNKLQKSQGFNLQKYAGKVCKQLKYTVHKNKTNPDDINVNLIVYDGNVIGGDLNKKYENRVKKVQNF